MAAAKPEVDELVAGQLVSVDGRRPALDQLDRGAVDEHGHGLGARDAAVAALDVL